MGFHLFFFFGASTGGVCRILSLDPSRATMARVFSSVCCPTILCTAVSDANCFFASFRLGAFTTRPFFVLSGFTRLCVLCPSTGRFLKLPCGIAVRKPEKTCGPGPVTSAFVRRIHPLDVIRHHASREQTRPRHRTVSTACVTNRPSTRCAPWSPRQTTHLRVALSSASRGCSHRTTCLLFY